MTAKVKADVNGCLLYGGEFIELDHDREWADDDPFVVAYPDAFDVVKGPKAPKGDAVTEG